MVVQTDARRLAELAHDVADGSLVLPIAKTFPLTAIEEETRLAERGGAEGKVVLIVAGAVSWPQRIVMAGLSAVGGYGGALTRGKSAHMHFVSS